MLDQDDEFVSICEFARHYYYEHRWQIMPLSPRSKVPPKDFPAIDLQKGLLDAETFERMWGPNGAFVINNNCGVLCGAPSGGLFVVDLDTKKPGSRAQAWWDNLHAMRPHPETPTQITGSGGIQIFFRMPEGMKGFNHKSAYLNVDFQGEGAYVALPPSIHPNGNTYRWVDGMSPDECDIMVLPDYLIEEIRAIIGHGGDGVTGSSSRVKTDTPQHQVDPWGKVVDGREDLMTRIVFRAVLELYRDCPIIPTDGEQKIAIDLGFKKYVDAVSSRLHEPGEDRAALLEKEGRGRTLFEKKWRAAIRQWDDKISTEASRPFLKNEPEKIDPFAEPPPKAAEEPTPDPKPENPLADESEFDTVKKKLLKLYTIDEIKSFGPVKALVQDTIAEGSLGFIYGQPGCGKTFVALSLGLSIAFGLESWFWGKKIERSGPVIYISLEGKADLGNRLLAWQNHHNLPVDNKRFRAVVDEVNFLSDESIKLFVDSLDDYVSSDAPPAMIFIDTVSRAIAGGAENDQQEMSKFIQTCDRIKSRYTSNVTGIHHSGRFGNHMRGSTTFDGGADFMFRVERTKETKMNGIIHAEKIKAYADKWEMPFKLEEVVLDKFGAQTSLVATANPEPASAASTAGRTFSEGAGRTFSEGAGRTFSEGADFGGKQETGKEPDMETCRKMVNAIHEAWVGGYPWGLAKESDRNAAEKLSERFSFSVDVCSKYVSMWHRNDVIITDRWGDKNNKKGLRVGKGL